MASHVRNEFHANFPLVRLVRSRAAYRFLEFVDTLSSAERVVAASAFAMRFFVDTRLSPGSTVKSEEEEILLRFKDFDIRRIDPAVPAEYESRTEWQFWERAGTTPIRLPAPKLASLIQSKLLATAGVKPSSLGPGIILYSIEASGRRLRTSIDSSVRLADYAHSIFAQDNEPEVRFVSVLSWMGISGQTDWSLFTEDEVDAVSEELTAHIVWFWRRWTEIIDTTD